MQLVFHGVHAISIHALREESDFVGFRNPDSFHISIHALREESDPHRMVAGLWTRHFNPRSP